MGLPLLPLITTFAVTLALPVFSTELQAAPVAAAPETPLSVFPLVNSLIMADHPSTSVAINPEKKNSDTTHKEFAAPLQATENCRDLSRTQVNLIEITGDTLTDVVFDELALNITADSAKGKAYIRVKPGFAVNGKETGAFFNTAHNTYAVTFCIKDLPSQIIRLQALLPHKESSRTQALPPAAAIIHAADPLEVMIKNWVRFAYTAKKVEKERETGALYATQDSEQPQAIEFSQRTVSWQGFRVRQTQAWSTAGHFIELLAFTNLSTYERRVPYAEAARAASGTIAVASTSQRLPSGATARVVLIRSRMQAQTPDGLVLSAEQLAESTL